MRMSSIRSVFCLLRPKKKSFSVTEKAMVLLWNGSVFIKGNYKLGSWSSIPFCFSCYETPEQSLWSDSSTYQVLHCAIPSGSSFYTAQSFVSCHSGRALTNINLKLTFLGKDGLFFSVGLGLSKNSRSVSIFRGSKKARNLPRMWGGNEVEA